jgi:hypothetical protein
MLMRLLQIAKWFGICLAALVVVGAIWVFWLWRYFAPPPLNPPVENPRYSRNDCMGRAAIQYPKAAKQPDAKDIIGGQITEVILAAIHEKRFPVASMGINSSNIHNLYALFTQKCDRKYQMVEEIVDAYLQEYPDGIRITITRDSVTPSLDTIQMFGPYWTDGKRSHGAK